MLIVTLKWAKQMFVFIIFKGCTLNKVCSLACLKAKNEEKLLLDQKPFWTFLERKKKFNKF